MPIVCRIHERGDETLVAACDQELLGRTFREGKLRIEVKEAFYDGDVVSSGELADRFAEATIANLTGEETVAAAIELGFVAEENVLRIDGVPHAQFVTMR